MKVFAFVGPSGGGKSTLQHALNMRFLTNCTTRPLRVQDGEIQGVHINQVAFEEFKELEQSGYFFETTEYAGNLYGTPAKTIDDILYHNIPYHATLTADGALKLREKLGKERVRILYIKPPSLIEMERRMRNRGDSEEKIRQRISYAFSADEFANESIADYVVINDSLGRAQIEVQNILIGELTDCLMNPHKFDPSHNL